MKSDSDVGALPGGADSSADVRSRSEVDLEIAWKKFEKEVVSTTELRMAGILKAAFLCGAAACNHIHSLRAAELHEATKTLVTQLCKPRSANAGRRHSHKTEESANKKP